MPLQQRSSSWQSGQLDRGCWGRKGGGCIGVSYNENKKRTGGFWGRGAVQGQLLRRRAKARHTGHTIPI